MATSLITGVTLSDTSVVSGECDVANAAFGVYPDGVFPPHSSRHLVHSNQNGANVDLSLVGEWEPPPATAVSLPLSGPPLVLATLGDQLRVGEAYIENTAQAMLVAGVPPPALATLAIVSDDAIARKLELDLSQAYTAPTAHNVGFYFGGPLVTAGVSAGDQALFGQASLRKALGIRPLGVLATAPPSKLVVSYDLPARYLELDLDGGYTSPVGSALSVPLSGAPIIIASAGDQLRIGYSDVVNAAQATYPFGIPPGRIGFVRADDGGIGGHIALDLEGNYEPPNAAAIQLFWASDDKAVDPDGLDSLVWGTAELTLTAQGAFAEGFVGVSWGAADIRGGPHYVLTVGSDTSSYGLSQLTKATKEIYPGGIAPPPQTGPNGNRQVPNPWSSYRVRYLSPTGIGAPSGQVPTNISVTPELQFVDLAGGGILKASYGNGRISYAVRYLSPPFISSNVFGATNVARIQVVDTAGWDSSFVSQGGRLDINLQRLLAHSGVADPALYGELSLRNEREFLAPAGWQDGEINFPVLYNLDQYLHVASYDGSTSWSNFYPYVENVDRVLGPGSWTSARFSFLGTYVDNAADPVIATGLDATLWGAGTFIAYRDRYVLVSGWESFYSARYSVVFNDAVVVSPTGWASSKLGAPGQVLALNKTLKHIFPYDGEAFGPAFVAYAERYISPTLFYGVPASLPEVRFDPYPITVAGIDSYRSGGQDVFERFNIVYPASTNVHPVPLVGEPIIKNRNKTLAVFPSDQLLFGLSLVYNYDQYLAQIGGSSIQWGAHLISDRTRTLVVAPISVPVFTASHRAKNDIPDPPAQQLILVSGLAPPGVPAPKTQLPTLFPQSMYAGGYGTPVLTRNTVNVVPGMYNPDQFGTPEMVLTRYVYPKTLPWPNFGNPPQGSSDQNWTIENRPRVTPHTIYAPASTEATTQARNNHGGTFGLPIGAWTPDGQWSQGGGYPWFGRPATTNRDRTVGPVPNHYGNFSTMNPSSRIGAPSLQLRLRYVQVYPIRSFRAGLPMFLGVPQFVNLDTLGKGIAPYNKFGATQIAPPPMTVTPVIKPQGATAPGFGSTEVQLFNREVAPAAINHRGNPQQNLTSPWGVPLIGYPREYLVGGIDATIWGTTWFSHYTRSVEPVSWNSLTIGEDLPGFFSDRMRVARRNPAGGLKGIETKTAFGQAIIAASTRSVVTRLMPNFQSGIPFVRAEATIDVQSWLSSAFGLIDEWEAGKIKAAGDALGNVPIPRIGHPVSTSGFAGVVNDPRIGALLYIYGMPPIGFEGPVVSNPSGCNNRIVSPLPVISTMTVPDPAVNS